MQSLFISILVFTVIKCIGILCHTSHITSLDSYKSTLAVEIGQDLSYLNKTYIYILSMFM